MFMLSRDRVRNAIEHRKVDRVPRDLGGVVSGISKIAYEKLLIYMNKSNYSIHVYDTIQQLAQVDESILSKFKIDTRHIRANASGSRLNHTDSFKDIFGITYQRVGTSEIPTLYYEMMSYPLADASLADIQKYEWPVPSESWFSGLSKLVKRFWDDGYAVIANPISGGILEQTVYLRGLQQFMYDLYGNRELIEELLDRNVTNQLEMNEKYLEEVGEYSLILIYGDDYGHQDRLLMHPEMWRELVKPRVKEFIKCIKGDFSHIKIQLHSCGSVAPIIPDLIEIGFDILNPVQPRAVEMDHDVLNEKFGSKICFHAGFDIQYVLPRGSQNDIEQEVKRVVSSLGRDNTGYIFATAHNILADVPPENIIRMYDALDRFDETSEI